MIHIACPSATWILHWFPFVIHSTSSEHLTLETRSWTSHTGSWATQEVLPSRRSLPQEDPPLKSSLAKARRSPYPAQGLRKDPDPRQASPVTKQVNQLIIALRTVTPTTSPCHQSFPGAKVFAPAGRREGHCQANRSTPGPETGVETFVL